MATSANGPRRRIDSQPTLGGCLGRLFRGCWRGGVGDGGGRARNHLAECFSRPLPVRLHSRRPPAAGPAAILVARGPRLFRVLPPNLSGADALPIALRPPSILAYP